MVKSEQHDLGREGERCHYCPRRKRAVVGTPRNAPRDIIEKLMLDAVDFDDGWTGAFARGYSPAA